MKIKILLWFPVIFMLLSAQSCGPKEIETAAVPLHSASVSWVPFYGTEYIVFINIKESDTSRMVFKGQGFNKTVENKIYQSDQSGFLSMQKDYYADFEMWELDFISDETPYIISYKLESNKGDAGQWDNLVVEMQNGNYYKNELLFVTYKNSKFDFGEKYLFKNKLILNNQTFYNVYYWKQNSRPMELYFTKEQGVIAFKITATELWTIEQDSI